jgi:hypothetical protein
MYMIKKKQSAKMVTALRYIDKYSYLRVLVIFQKTKASTKGAARPFTPHRSTLKTYLANALNAGKSFFHKINLLLN